MRPDLDHTRLAQGEAGGPRECRADRPLSRVRRGDAWRGPGRDPRAARWDHRSHRLLSHCPAPLSAWDGGTKAIWSRSAPRNPCPYPLMKVVQRGFGEHLDERDRARQLEASCDYRAQCERVETPEEPPTDRLGQGATIPFGWMEKHFPTAPTRVGVCS